MTYEKNGKTFEFGDAIEVTCTSLPEHECRTKSFSSGFTSI